MYNSFQRHLFNGQHQQILISSWLSKTYSNKLVIISNCMMCNDGASHQLHALHSAINVQYISDLIAKLYDCSVSHHQQILVHRHNIKTILVVFFITNVAAFFLQVTRVFFFLTMQSSSAYYKIADSQLVQYDEQISYSRFDIENECSGTNYL